MFILIPLALSACSGDADSAENATSGIVRPGSTDVIDGLNAVQKRDLLNALEAVISHDDIANEGRLERMLEEWDLKGPLRDSLHDSIEARSAAKKIARGDPWDLEWIRISKERQEAEKLRVSPQMKSIDEDIDRLAEYEAFVAEESKAVELIEAERDSVKLRMDELLDSALSYLNDVIVNDELPIRKLDKKRLGNYFSESSWPIVMDSPEAIELVEKTKRSLDSQATEGEDAAYRTYQFAGEKHFLVSRLHYMPGGMKDDGIHSEHILPIYMQYVGVGRSLLEFAARLKVAKDALRSRSIVASNKFDLEDYEGLKFQVNRKREKLLSRIESAGKYQNKDRSIMLDFGLKVTAEERQSIVVAAENLASFVRAQSDSK